VEDVGLQEVVFAADDGLQEAQGGFEVEDVEAFVAVERGELV